MAVRNGSVYFHVSVLSLLIASTVGLGVSRAFSCLMEKRLPKQLTGQYTVRVMGREKTLTLFTDSGNHLSAFGYPVAVVSRERLAGLLPESFLACSGDISRIAALSPRIQRMIMLVPCRTAAGQSLLPSIKAELTRLRDGAVFHCYR